MLPAIIDVGPLNKEQPEVLGVYIGEDDPKTRIEPNLDVVKSRIEEACQAVGSVILELELGDEGIYVVFSNPNTADIGEAGVLEAKSTIEPGYEPGESSEGLIDEYDPRSKIYRSPEEITQHNREKAPFKSKEALEFSGYCHFCKSDVTISEVYKGKKPEVGNKKKKFDLDYGIVSCQTEGCVDNTSMDKDENGVEHPSKYFGKPHEVIVFRSYEFDSNLQAKQWISDNIESNK